MTFGWNQWLDQREQAPLGNVTDWLHGNLQSFTKLVQEVNLTELVCELDGGRCCKDSSVRDADAIGLSRDFTLNDMDAISSPIGNDISTTTTALPTASARQATEASCPPSDTNKDSGRRAMVPVPVELVVPDSSQVAGTTSSRSRGGGSARQHLPFLPPAPPRNPAASRPIVGPPVVDTVGSSAPADCPASADHELSPPLPPPPPPPQMTARSSASADAQLSTHRSDGCTRPHSCPTGHMLHEQCRGNVTVADTSGQGSFSTGDKVLYFSASRSNLAPARRSAPQIAPMGSTQYPQALLR